MKADETLLEELKRGREAAAVEIYRRHQRELFRFAWHVTGCRETAEEAVQESFLALLRHPGAFDAKRGSLRAFLFGITRNQVWKRLADHREFDELNVEAVADGNLLDDLARDERIVAVREAIWSLPPVYREVVVLCEMQEASYEEAARVAGCPVGTVRSRLNRAKALLAAKLQAQRAGRLV